VEIWCNKPISRLMLSTM